MSSSYTAVRGNLLTIDQSAARVKRTANATQGTVLLPLTRESLYQKVARAVMPGGVNVLPRGVLLTGPPGTGKTWSMRALAGEAGLPVVALPCEALMTKWYGESERRPAGRMMLFMDEFDALARHRRDSHESTARLVSILLACVYAVRGTMVSSSVPRIGGDEMPGLAERVTKLEEDVGTFDMQAKQHFDEQFRLLSEAIGEVRGQVEVLDGKVTALDGKVTALDGTVTAVDKRVDRFERDVRAAFVGVDSRLGRQDRRLGRMSADIKELLRRTAPKHRKPAPSRKKR